MIGNEIEKRNQFESSPYQNSLKIEGQEIETAHKSVVSRCFHIEQEVSKGFRVIASFEQRKSSNYH